MTQSRRNQKSTKPVISDNYKDFTEPLSLHSPHVVEIKISAPLFKQNLKAYLACVSWHFSLIISATEGQQSLSFPITSCSFSQLSSLFSASSWRDWRKRSGYLKYCLVFLCGQHQGNCVHFCAWFHWRFSANSALCQDLVTLPEGSAPGILRLLMTKPQACCAPCSTRIGLSSLSLPHTVYHKPSTPVKLSAWRSWAHWPIWEVETYLENHWEETLSPFCSLLRILPWDPT